MELVQCMELPVVESPFELLIRAALLTPITQYLFGLLLILIVFLYNFVELHLIQDLLTGFRGQPVTLTFNPASQLYHDVVSKCRVLHRRFLSTPWLCSPHLQTLFVHYFGNAPAIKYRSVTYTMRVARQLFTTSDGGTLALDWVITAEVKKPWVQVNDAVQHDDGVPIIIIIPGLASASDSAYVKHLAFKMAKRGWNVVVCNHRGVGGVSVTSDCFYTGGWTEDARKVIEHIHCKYPEAPLFVVGTSIGANIMVKYLGEDGNNVPIVGAAAICSPWDLLLGDRFLSRRLVQRFYNKAMTVGLKDYAYMHESLLSRLSNWEGVKKACSLREFDDSATRFMCNCETVDTYYRRNSSTNFVGNVKVPLLCVNSLDDPVCSSEAIPWDECRLNKNVILATTEHGGHLPFFEGLFASSIWWIRAVDEFFEALLTSTLKKEVELPVSHANPLESSIDQAPYIRVSAEGMVTSVNDEPAKLLVQDQENTDQNKTQPSICAEGCVQEIQIAKPEPPRTPDIVRPPEQDTSDVVGSVRKRLNQLSRQNGKSMWLLAYIAIITTWPVLGPALAFFFRKRFQNFFSRSIRR